MEYNYMIFTKFIVKYSDFEHDQIHILAVHPDNRIVPDHALFPEHKSVK